CVTIQPWRIRNLNELRRHDHYNSWPPVNPAKFQPPGMPITCRYFRRLNDRFVPRVCENYLRKT
ncbi:MAG: hypothetical protein O7F15_10035, partial [Gammaproteobacteria bacterium]|nr:hypothetical protein [Gammaproteobacteria bacterium]